MKYLILWFTAFSAMVSIPTYSDQTVSNKNSLAFSFYDGWYGTQYKRALNPSWDFTTSFALSYYYTEDKRLNKEMSCDYTQKRDYTRYKLFGGVRKNFNLKTVRWFLQPEIGVVGDQRRYESETSCENINYGDDSTIHTIGVGINALLGGEYFLSDGVSIEGATGLAAEYLFHNFEKEDQEDRLSVYNFSQVSLRLYW